MQNGVTDLSKLSSADFQTYGIKHATQFEYRIELATRIASTFKVEHLIVFDDIALTVSKSTVTAGLFIAEVKFSSNRHFYINVFIFFRVVIDLYYQLFGLQQVFNKV